jgi:hypothetical protein
MRDPASRPRLEAVELASLLRIEGFSYWESDSPTFRGVMQGRVFTVQQQVGQPTHGKQPLIRLIKGQKNTGKTAVFQQLMEKAANAEEGELLAPHWVIVDVQQLPTRPAEPRKSQTLADRSPNTRRRHQIALQVSLDEAAAAAGLTLDEEPSDTTLAAAAATIAQAKERGKDYLVLLISEGRLVPAKEIADYWGITSQALGNRKRAGDVLGLMVNNRLWYPAELKSYATREDAERVCARLKTLPAIEQFLVLSNTHRVLGDRTIAHALREGMHKQVDRLLDSVVEAE